MSEDVNLLPYEGISLFCCGQSGTGKTTVLRMICSQLAEKMPVIVLDPRRSEVWDGKTRPFDEPWSRRTFTEPKSVLAALVRRRSRIVYRPDPEWRDERRERIGGRWETVKPIEQFYTALYRYVQSNIDHGVKRPFAIFTADLHELLRDPQPGDGSRKLQTLAREPGVIRIWASQRSKGLPLYVISESQWRFCWRLGHTADLALMQSMLGEKYSNPPKGSMVYWMSDDGECRQVNFDVGEGRPSQRSSDRAAALREWAPSST